MTQTLIGQKITPKHLARKAIVYLRQSSERQAQENLESQRLQYSLETRARELGWHEVKVIDEDLGSSASVGARERRGFQSLIASVALGEVGIVLSREASRLSRTDKDWCHLLEVCQVFNTLLGDSECVYDLGSTDDQLVLGIKGTMSVVELNVLRMRLVEGMQEKARRGKLFRTLSPGFVLDGDEVVKHPDTRVREAIDLVFRKFRELRSIRQTYLWFHSHGVELPVNHWEGGKAQLRWKLPSNSFVNAVLHNVFYAGAYVWGQHPIETRIVDGRLVKRQGSLRAPEDCKVFIKDHHEGYIDWETYEDNQRMIRSNDLKNGMDESVAAVRSGHGLLTGLLRCGICGRKLHVRYWGKSGTAARYACLGDYGCGGSYCLAFGGSTVDKVFSKELLRVISPLGVQASLEAVDRLSKESSDEEDALRRQLKQIEYEVQRSFEQYDSVDPRNRLVAEELERRWNRKLKERDDLVGTLDAMALSRPSVTEQEKERILELGEDFAQVWSSTDCPMELKKKIARTVIEEVIVSSKEGENESEELLFTIHWNGGVHTQFTIPKPSSARGQKTSKGDLEIIRALAPRYGDDAIARVLSKLKRRTGKGKRWNASRVYTVRQNYSISGQKRSKADPEVLTLSRASQYCGVSDTVIRKLVEAEVLHNNQTIPWAPWEISRSELDSEPIQKIVNHLRLTGKLRIKGVRLDDETTLFDL